MTLILLASIATPLIAFFPQASASVSSTQTYLYVGVSPNPVGVGQQALIVAWTQAMPPDIGETEGKVPAPNGRAAWEAHMMVNIVKPDGTNDTQLELPRTDPVGATFGLYVPETAGNYTIQVYYPGEWRNSTVADVQAYFTSAWSAPITLTVQEEAVQNWVESPVTDDWWTRPINDANREWYTLAGNWFGLFAAAYPPGSPGPTGAIGAAVTSNTQYFSYGKGPETAHILWTKPYYAGGIMDSRFESDNGKGNWGFETAHYQGYNFGNPIILQGKLIYQYQNTGHAALGWQAVDLYTGEQIYFSNDTIPSYGQIYNYESPNQHGGIPYLYRTVTTGPSTVWGNGNGTVYDMMDGYTFSHVAFIANVSTAGTMVYGLDGSLLRYNIFNAGTNAAPKYYLQVWNSSAIPSELGSTSGTTYWQWRPQGGAFGAGPALSYTIVHNGAQGFSLNVSLPTDSVWGPRNSVVNQTGSIYSVRQDESIIIGTSGYVDESGTVKGQMVCLSLVPGQAGTQLWKTSFTPPSSANNASVSLMGVYPEYDRMVFYCKSLLKWYGYSLSTGQLMWTSEPQTQFVYYGSGNNMYEGILYTYGYGGVVYAYDLESGELLWQYAAKSVGDESPYGGNYPIGINLVADDKLYLVGSEHSPTQPLYRGPNLRCINATSGEEIWKILFWGARMSPTESNIYMADGILVGLNYYDGEIYAFGRGPSATTVTAANPASTLGSTVLIQGTVTDQTPSGKRTTNDILDFSLKGTPAISDEDMTAWMEYKFMQQPEPVDAKGVPVTLATVDPNGNYREIGEATSDMYGNYAVPFTPDVPGTYQILATFAGSKSYGPSASSTYLTVTDQSTPAPTAATSSVSVADQYFIPAVIAIIITIILVGVVLGVLLLRKRP
ncbi:MAG: PQQ-binding-like beta-propeller repeat protein [Candidatus Bathyarchaeota archaeon]|nr:PQQ-binding-like beta-propeller repeat protein [Candidatus Bathyarchaeota archaeon]